MVLTARVERSQQATATVAQAPVAGRIRTNKIKAAVILGLWVGAGLIILSLDQFRQAIGYYELAMAPGAPDWWSELTLSSMYGNITIGVIACVFAVFHLLGCYWLWGGKIRGGVIALIVGAIDLYAFTMFAVALMDVFSALYSGSLWVLIPVFYPLLVFAPGIFLLILTFIELIEPLKSVK